MYGAILGDMIGAPYEFDRGNKKKDFPLFSAESNFTDDTVMTIAVAEALLATRGKNDEVIKAELVASMRDWGKRYPDAGYGGMFARWLVDENPQPYGSFGNGSAMRVAAAGWLADSEKEAVRLAKLTAEVTHNHPEGIKGAAAVAGAIFWARLGGSKDVIKSFVTETIGYDLSRTCDEIRPEYCHDETCQKSVPEAITAFLEGKDFEDVIRTTVSLGGDTDTLACIAGSIAEAYYGIPDRLIVECRNRLPNEMRVLIDRFQKEKGKCLAGDEPHRYTNNHKPELEKDSICGCGSCMNIYSPSEIEEWLIADNNCDCRGTAVCPKCGIDAVIGESSGYPITREFLKAMNEKWF